MTSSGGGLFRWPSATPGLSSAPTAAPQQPALSSSLGDNDSAHSRRRHGSAPLAAALGLRRGSTPAGSTSSSSASRSRSLAADMPPPPRKMSEPGTTYKPASASPPKRKPLPKGSAFEKQAVQDDDVSGKLGKMELTSGSTMVLTILCMMTIANDDRSSVNACAVIRIYGFPLPCPVIDAPSVSVSTTSNPTSPVKASNLFP
jgi:hypothetical protein